jgi:hypothetical protein
MVLESLELGFRNGTAGVALEKVLEQAAEPLVLVISLLSNPIPPDPRGPSLTFEKCVEAWGINMAVLIHY